ncbi:MAG: YjbQ family protein [Candidatus Aenigmatarchaeota archaeon]|nr:MAG: YjbQ family protein [Candidatus Aenigmarchaeota archaeon]
MFSETFSIRTRGTFDLFEITDKVEEIVRDSNAKEGMCFIFVPHTTACLIMNERESGFLKDFRKTILKLVPREGNYEHNRLGEGNANAHIISSIIKPYLVLPVESSSLNLGTWQNLFFLELDGPRTRNVSVKIFK